MKSLKTLCTIFLLLAGVLHAPAGTLLQDPKPSGDPSALMTFIRNAGGVQVDPLTKHLLNPTPPDFYSANPPPVLSLLSGGTGTLNLAGYTITLPASLVGTGLGTLAAGNDSRFRATFTPEMFLAAGDGDTDDTAAVQNALNAAATSGGRLLLSKVYLVSSTISWTGNVTIDGGGTILCNFAAGDILHFAPASAPTALNGNTLADTDGLQHLVFRNFQIQSLVTRTSGSAIYVQYAFNPLFENLTIGKFDLDPTHTLPFYDGIYCSRSSNPRILNNDIRCRHKGILFSGGIGQRFFQFDGLITGNEIWGGFLAGSVAVQIGGDTGGCILGPNSYSQFDQGLLVDTSLEPASNRELFIYGHCFWDSIGVYGIHVAPNSLQIFRTSDLWVAGVGRMPSGAAGGNVGVGVYIEAQGPGFYSAFNGGHVYSCNGHGLRLSGVQATVTGVTFRQNGLGTNGGSGIVADGGSILTLVGGEVISNSSSQIDVTGSFLATIVGANLQSGGGPPLVGTPSSLLKVVGCAGISDVYGAATFNGTITSQGANASHRVIDRTTNDTWDMYAAAGTLGFYNVNGNVFTVDKNGALGLTLLNDSDAANDRMYRSRQNGNAPVYKDAAGTVHPFY